MDMDNLALEVRTQADRLFPNRTDTSMYLKMYSELGELIDSGGSAEEYADIMIMLLDFGSRKMFPIEKVIREKMAINEKRKWEMSNLGVMRHV